MELYKKNYVEVSDRFLEINSDDIQSIVNLNDISFVKKQNDSYYIYVYMKHRDRPITLDVEWFETIKDILIKKPRYGQNKLKIR